MKRILSIILIVVILGAAGTLGYIIATPEVGERFTEFYILGLEGKAENYPKEMTVGEEASVIVGIINREHEVVTYRLEVRIDGATNHERGPLLLEHDEKWEATVGFTPDKTGNNQQVELLLYKNEGSEPYLTLHLWVNVLEQED